MHAITEFIRYNPESGRFTWSRHNGFMAKGSEARGQGRYINLKGKRYNAAKVAWYLQTGEWPGGRIKFLNGDAQDYRWVNLSRGEKVDTNKTILVTKENGEFYIDGEWVESAAAVLEAVWGAIS